MVKTNPSKKTMRRRLDDILRPTSKLFWGNTCQTCNTHIDNTKSKQLHWSHYISRKYVITRWDLRCCIVQCEPCHRKYTDGFCGPMVKAVNSFWGEIYEKDIRKQNKGIFSYYMTDWLEMLAQKHSSIKGTPWDKVPFRMTLESNYKALHNYLKEGGIPSGEQLDYIKEFGYPCSEEIQQQKKEKKYE